MDNRSNKNDPLWLAQGNIGGGYAAIIIGIMSIIFGVGMGLLIKDVKFILMFLAVSLGLILYGFFQIYVGFYQNI